MKLTSASLFIATIAFSIFILIIGFAPTLSNLFSIWSTYDESYGHGFLILGISVYLIYDSVPKLKSIRIQPFVPAVLPLFLLSLSWSIGYFASITVIQQLVLPLVIVCSIAVIAGIRMAIALLFPVLFLFFAIPVWDFLTNILVHLTVTVVQKMLAIGAITALIEGNSIQMAFGQITIADSCSGIRYLIVGTALSFLNAAMNFQTISSRIVIIGGGIALSLMANWIRVYSLILIGHFSKMQSSLMNDHEYYGWIIFIVILAPMFLAARFTRGSTQNAPLSPEASVPIEKETIRAMAIASIFAFLALFSGPALVQIAPSHIDTNFNLAFNPEPDWEISKPISNNWVPTLPSPYKHISQTLTNGSQSLNLHIYVYKKQSVDSKLLPYIASVYDKRTWYIIESKVTSLKSKNETITLNQTRLKRKGSIANYRMWYWYDVGGINTATYEAAKLSQIVSAISGKGYALIYLIERKCTTTNCAESNDILGNFIASSNFNADSLMEE